MASVQIKRGTRAQIEAAKTANGLLNGEPYLITDESRLAVGTGVAGYSDCAKKSEVDGKEPVLGNPASDGQVLASTAAGVRSWVSGGDSPGMVLLATATASNVTSVDFTSGIDSTYDEYEIHVQDALLAQLCMRVSTDGGSTWLTSGYNGMWHRLTDNTGTVSTGQISNAAKFVSSDISVDTYPYNGTIKIYRPHTGTYRMLSWELLLNRYYRMFGVGHGGSAAINAIRLLANSGNVLSGYFKLYGLRKTV